MIINEQKHPWCWRERLFYLFKDGSIMELTHYYTKGGYNHYLVPKDFVEENVVARVICKSRIDQALTVQTGKTHYKPSIIPPILVPEPTTFVEWLKFLEIKKTKVKMAIVKKPSKVKKKSRLRVA